MRDENENRLNAGQLLHLLTSAVEESQKQCQSISPGLLTSDDRGHWFEGYKSLKAAHPEEVESIETASFVLCLDGSDRAEDLLTSTALHSLHGGGSGMNGGNRWFDKALQFIIAKSGQVAICNEHSFAEAVPTMNMADFLIDYLSDPNLSLDSQSQLCPIRPRLLTFERWDPATTGPAADRLDALVSDLDMKVLDFSTFGKEAVKGLKLSPDSFIQMAIQLTFHQLHRVPAATYESAATRIFHEGRTEVIRSCSNESMAFVQQMQDVSQSLGHKKESLLKAMKAHNSYARLAVQGRGVDRHLQGLRKAASEMGYQLPELYNDPGYTRSSKMRLSTSQVKTKKETFLNKRINQDLIVVYEVINHICFTVTRKNMNLAVY